MKVRVQGSLILVLIAAWLVLANCGGSPNNAEDNCELVTQGESFLKVINKLNSEVDVFFVGFAFEALMEPGVCEIFGLPSGNRVVDVKKRPNGPTKRVNFTVARGETHTITVTESFF